jgi:PB1 domain
MSNTNVSVKLSIGQETRRVSVGAVELTLSKLIQTAETLFPKLQSYSSLAFTYQDEDDDTVTLSTEDELKVKARGKKLS